jgi:general secretion pathway protein I
MRFFRREAARGFTLVEVMAALAILALGLTVLLQSTAKTVRAAEQSRMRGVAAALARGALWDVEEQLRKDGFQETDQSSEGDFEEQGWPQIKWKADVRRVELPSPEQLAAMAEQQAQQAAAAAAAQAGAGAGTGTGTGSAAPLMEGGGGLLGMLSMFGGGFTAEDVAGGNFLAGGGYTIIQDVFKVAIRKIVLTVSWKALGQEESFDVVYYVTDPDAMNRVLGGGISGAGSDAYGQDAAPPGTQLPSSGTGASTGSTGTKGSGSTTTGGGRR